jgi:hypothetical protein
MPTADDDPSRLERGITRAGWLIAIGSIVGTLLVLVGGFLTFALVAAGEAGCTTDCNDQPLFLDFAAFVLGFVILAGSLIGGLVTRSRLRRRLNAILR